MEFKKEIFENLLECGVNSRIPELSPGERRMFYDVMEGYGLKKMRAYTRIFRTGVGSGFDEWELRGVCGIIDDFTGRFSMPPCPREDMCRFYTDVLDGRKAEFWEFVRPMGMGKNSCIRRMTNWDFQEWELVGIRSIIEGLCGG